MRSERNQGAGIGRHVFGAAAIMIGIVGLAWGDFAGVWQPVRPGVPHRTALAYLYALVFLAGGIAVQPRRTARAGLVPLGVLYLLAALLWVPRVVNYPRIFATWDGVAEQLAPVAAGAMCFAALSSARWAPRLARACAVLFGVCAMSFGVLHFVALEQTAAMVPTWPPFGQRFWAMATGACLFAAGLAIALGVQATLAARLLTVLVLAFGAFVWLPMIPAHPHDHTVWAGNAINLGIAGAAWMVADVLRARTHTRAPASPTLAT